MEHPTFDGSGKENGQRVCDHVVTGKLTCWWPPHQSFYISTSSQQRRYIRSETIEFLERDHVLDHIWEKGGLPEKSRPSLTSMNWSRLSGCAPMFFITFRREQAGTHKAKRMILHAGSSEEAFFLPTPS